METLQKRIASLTLVAYPISGCQADFVANCEGFLELIWDEGINNGWRPNYFTLFHLLNRGSLKQIY